MNVELRARYVVVQRTGFVAYFLSVWRDGVDSWDSARSRTLLLDGPTARRIVAQLSAQRPGAPVLPHVEASA